MCIRDRSTRCLCKAGAMFLVGGDEKPPMGVDPHLVLELRGDSEFVMPR